MNQDVTYQVLQSVVDYGVREFVMCAGSRNSSFVEALRLEENLHVVYWPEERSGAFYALGRSRLTKRPVAVVVTSGTAAGELLPAAMEAFHSNVPLVLITADRPACFRGSGGPQCADQLHMFGSYAPFFQDVGEDVPCDLSEWDRCRPAHLNVCLKEPQSQPKFQGQPLFIPRDSVGQPKEHEVDHRRIDAFIRGVKRPLVVVSALLPETQDIVVRLLETLGAPVILEGVSGIREEPSLQHLRIHRNSKIFESAKASGYSIDGVLRIGSVPTHRLWRDLEYLEQEVKVCSISDLPFSGLSWDRHIIPQKVCNALSGYVAELDFDAEPMQEWLEQESIFQRYLLELFEEEPNAEPSLVHALSKIIPNGSHVYLGNSMPIREWDMCATNEPRQFQMTASRGLSGIDGQISTFLGLSRPERENWAIIGDLTALYDLAGFWVLQQMEAMPLTVVIVNNGGGKIFERISPIQEMQNLHHLNFEPLAHMWGLDYARWEMIPEGASATKCRLIEIVPDEDATRRFWAKLGKVDSTQRHKEIYNRLLA